MRRVRILVADDHAVVRRGVRALLEAQQGWEVCGEATSGRQAVEKVRQLKPDVAIVDISMPELSGLEATRQIAKLAPQTRVLILTMHDSAQMIEGALHAGARGCVLKIDTERDLVAAVKALSQDKVFFTSTVSSRVLERHMRGEHEDQSVNTLLTPRERQIVELLAQGDANKEVAFRLGISVRTVEAHRAKIMRKLGCRSLSDLIHYAIRAKIVELKDLTP